MAGEERKAACIGEKQSALERYESITSSRSLWLIALRSMIGFTGLWTQHHSPRRTHCDCHSKRCHSTWYVLDHPILILIAFVLTTSCALPGHVVTVKEEGMPIFEGHGHGDLYVEFNVVLPPTIPDDVRTSTNNQSSIRHVVWQCCFTFSRTSRRPQTKQAALKGRAMILIEWTSDAYFQLSGREQF